MNKGAIFNWADWIAIALFFAAMVGIVWASVRKKVEDGAGYFLSARDANQRLRLLLSPRHRRDAPRGAVERFSELALGRTLPDVRGPGINNFDLSLVKAFKIGERLKAQFRGEFGVLTQECLDQSARVGAGLACCVRWPQVVNDFERDVHCLSSL